jgi:hypothetical protein
VVTTFAPREIHGRRVAKYVVKLEDHNAQSTDLVML